MNQQTYASEMRHPEGVIQVHAAQVGAKEAEAVARVIATRNLVMGKEVAAFEEEFAAFTGAKYAVALNSGTSALHAALLACNICPGDEVLVPAITFFATVEAVLYVGGIPRFTDINERACMGIEQFTDAIQRWPKAKAAIPVHYGGHPADVVEITKQCRLRGMVCIEDAAMAHGALVSRDSLHVGTIGDAGCFSFYATKYCTTGEGGMLITDNEAIAKDVRLRRVHGMIDRSTHITLGYNWRMSEIEAAIGRVQLEGLEERVARQTFHTELIYGGLSGCDWLQKLPRRFDDCPCYWFADVLLDPDINPQHFMAHLMREGIEPRYRYSEPLYMQPVMLDFYAAHGEAGVVDLYHSRCQRSLRYSSHLVGLPNRPDMTCRERARVISAVRGFAV